MTSNASVTRERLEKIRKFSLHGGDWPGGSLAALQEVIALLDTQAQALQEAVAGEREMCAVLAELVGAEHGIRGYCGDCRRDQERQMSDCQCAECQRENNLAQTIQGLRQELAEVSQKWLNSASERDEWLPIQAERDKLLEQLADSRRLCAGLMCCRCAEDGRPYWMVVFGGYTHVWKTGNGHVKCSAGPIWEAIDATDEPDKLASSEDPGSDTVPSHGGRD